MRRPSSKFATSPDFLPSQGIRGPVSGETPVALGSSGAADRCASAASPSVIPARNRSLTHSATFGYSFAERFDGIFVYEDMRRASKPTTGRRYTNTKVTPRHQFSRRFSGWLTQWQSSQENVRVWSRTSGNPLSCTHSGILV